MDWLCVDDDAIVYLGLLPHVLFCKKGVEKKDFDAQATRLAYPTCNKSPELALIDS